MGLQESDRTLAGQDSLVTKLPPLGDSEGQESLVCYSSDITEQCNSSNSSKLKK